MKDINKYEAAALEAITTNKSMGQMLRELPNDTPKEELQKYTKAYVELRGVDASTQHGPGFYEESK